MRILIFFMFLLTSELTFCQNSTIENKQVISIIDVEGKEKLEIYSLINKWISLNYNSAENVIDMSDKESGTFIIKGINSVIASNPLQSIWSNSKSVPKYSKVFFNHVIEFNIKDYKFRVKYKVTRLADGSDMGLMVVAPESDYFNAIGLDFIDDQKVLKYNNAIGIYQKKMMLSKKKREIYASSSKAHFEEISKNLLTNINLTIGSIKKSFNDDW